MKKKLLSTFVSLFLITATHEATAIPTQERSALTSFYNAANGDNWTNNSGWLGVEGTECSWYGIYCVGGHVVRINLENNGLSGSITPSLNQLPQLKTLILPSNNLAGEIPETLGQLSSLGLLKLEYNALNGTIPASLGTLSQLRHLSLDSNDLGGKIPSKLGQLFELLRFSAGNNHLTDSLPSELGALSKLKYLKLDHNNLTGVIPSTLGQLSQLGYLSLNSNQLTGSIPEELGQLSQLTTLALSYNELSGKIPSSLGQLFQLNSLWLNSNHLRGSIPSELGQLSQLTGVWLGDNLLTGIIPSDLIQLSKLRFFSSASNCVSTNDAALIDFIKAIDSVFYQPCHEEKKLLVKSVAHYNTEGKGVLTVEEVLVGDATYSVKLNNIGNNQFVLMDVVELTKRTHPTPALYNVESLELDIPVVYVPNLNTYQVKLISDANGVFSLLGVTSVK